MTRTIWAIDCTNWLHVIWHGQGGGDVLTPLVRRIVAIRDCYKPAAVFACFDCGESFRKQIDIAYKAKRQEYPESLTRQIGESPAAIPPWCIPLAVNGYEADDILATVAASRGDCRCVLATGDKDVRQCLVPGEVTICRKMSLFGSECRPEWYTAQDLANEYGFSPACWTEFQALSGDSTDGICGCAGIGDKTAREIIATAHNIDSAIENIWSLKLTGKRKAALLGFKGKAEHYRRLVRLVTDVPGIREAVEEAIG